MSVDAGAALLVERSEEQKSSLYSSLWDGRTSETAEHILAASFEDGSEYGTKDKHQDVGTQ